MVETKVIIIGAGPAGSTCAWKLKDSRIDFIILDKAIFPREKLCAGWITPKIWKMLETEVTQYPYSLTRFRRLNIMIFGTSLPVRTNQYAIRRNEFDQWLHQKAELQVLHHTVKNIVRENGYFIIDDLYRCEYLVGAAGTNCPVYRSFFKKIRPRDLSNLIICMEVEIPYKYKDCNCYIWFHENKLPGYSWYVPKKTNYLNLGIGAKYNALRRRNETINDHWDSFVKKLERLKLIKGVNLQPRGYQYYLRHSSDVLFFENAFVIGDAAGLATRDMGEGIGPAVASGKLVAEAILDNAPFIIKNLPRYSFWNIIFAR